jgi:hypothetical protein
VPAGVVTGGSFLLTAKNAKGAKDAKKNKDSSLNFASFAP